MALTLIPCERFATGFKFRFDWQPKHPAVKRLLTLSFWTFGFVASNIIALIVVRNLTEPGTSDTFAYFAAFTYFVLPQGLLGVSIATTFQPELARSVARREKAAFITTMSLGVRMTALLTIPAGVGLFVLRRPLVGLALENGKFGAEGALNASRALAGFALGLGAFSIYLFVLRGFYAHKDTKTPFKVNVVENTMNYRARLHPRRRVRGPRSRCRFRHRLRDCCVLGAAGAQLQGPGIRTPTDPRQHLAHDRCRRADGRVGLVDDASRRWQRRRRRPASAGGWRNGRRDRLLRAAHGDGGS